MAKAGVYRLFVFVLAAELLAACGGGGGGGGGDTSSSLFSVGGTVSGLGTGASVQLLNNGTDLLTVGASGSFTFGTKLAEGAVYNVTISSQTAGYTCSVANGTGNISSANITNVAVSCIGAAPNPDDPTVLSTTHKPTLVGIVIDSPIVNINYAGTSHTGSTDSAGQFNYEPGDLVAFKVGDIELPPVAAAPVITVQGMANAGLYPNRLTNIARFVQSLDTDGDVSAAITISSVAHTVGTAQTLDFTKDVNQFAIDADPIIAAVNTAGGTANTHLIDAATANAQALSALYALPRTSLIAGNWYSGSGATLQVLLLLDNGLYYMLDAQCGSAPSYEFGSYSYDQGTNQLTITAEDNHDGASCGLNSGVYSLGSAGSGFTLAGRTWQYIAPTTGQLTGVYGDGDFRSPGVGAEIHAFLQSGDYVELTDCSIPATSTTPAQLIPGIEAGTFTWNSSTKAFAVTSHLNSSSNSCASHTSQLVAPLTASLSTNLQSLNLADSNGPAYDLSALKPSLVGSSLLGAWGSGDVKNGGQIVFSPDGKVLVSYDCGGGTNSSREIGTFVWDSSTGNARVAISQDGNGTCGMNQLAPTITQLQPHGNMLDIVTSSADFGTISVPRYVGDGGLIGVWSRAALGSTPAMTIAVARDGFDQWFMFSLDSDCPIDSNDEGVTFNFDPNTSTLSNVIFNSAAPDVAACGLPATFGGVVTLLGDTLSIPGLGQFTRVQ